MVNDHGAESEEQAMSTEDIRVLAGQPVLPYRERCEVLYPADPAGLAPAVMTEWLLHVRQCPDQAAGQVEGICEEACHYIARLDCGRHDPDGLCGYCADTGIVSRMVMVPVQHGNRDEH